MSGYRERIKNRLPDKISVPKVDGIKGRVKGIMGRGDDSEQSTHAAAPLSTLRDPAFFGPPPVRRHIAAAPALERSDSDQQEPEEERPPPRPYRTDTTGLTTSHLPPPPGRRDSPNVSSPPPVGNRSGPPSLPPRLPPRNNSASPSTSSRPPLPVRTPTIESSSQRPPSSSSNSGYLNQGAISRLGTSGISVPGFGIGSNNNKPSPPPQDSPAAPPPSQMSELQSRFLRLGRSSSTDQATPPTTGSTWAQKQAALKTASSIRQDPSSVSLSDAKSAASTLNNFRQRHGDQVASGVRTANGLHERYTPSTTDGNGDGVSQNNSQSYNRGSAASTSSVSGISSLASSMIKKKPPPPPPPKKRQGLMSQPPQPSAGNAPPPVPLSTRPLF